MKQHVFRPRRRVNGKSQPGRLYRGRYRLDGDASDTEVSLNTTDKRVAEKKLAAIVEEQERERHGLIPPAGLRDGAARPLLDHLTDFIADLRACGRSRQYFKKIRQRVERADGAGIGSAHRLAPAKFRDSKAIPLQSRDACFRADGPFLLQSAQEQVEMLIAFMLLFCEVPAETLHWLSGTEVTCTVAAPAGKVATALRWDLAIAGTPVASGLIPIAEGGERVRIRVSPDAVRGTLDGMLRCQFETSGNTAHTVDRPVRLYPPTLLSSQDLDPRTIAVFGQGTVSALLDQVGIPFRTVNADTARLVRPAVLFVEQGALPPSASQQRSLRKLADGGCIVVIMHQAEQDAVLGGERIRVAGARQQRAHPLVRDLTLSDPVARPRVALSATKPLADIVPIVSVDRHPLVAVEPCDHGAVVYFQPELGPADPRLHLFVRNVLRWRPVQATRSPEQLEPTTLPEIQVPSGTNP